jgi:hypothetical protein
VASYRLDSPWFPILPGQWKRGDITGACALASIFTMGAFALLAWVRLTDQKDEAGNCPLIKIGVCSEGPAQTCADQCAQWELDSLESAPLRRSAEMSRLGKLAVSRQMFLTVGGQPLGNPVREGLPTNHPKSRLSPQRLSKR